MPSPPNVSILPSHSLSPKKKALNAAGAQPGSKPQPKDPDIEPLTKSIHHREQVYSDHCWLGATVPFLILSPCGAGRPSPWGAAENQDMGGMTGMGSRESSSVWTPASSLQFIFLP